MKFREPHIYNSLTFYMGGVCMGFLGGTTVGVMALLGKWNMYNTVVLGTLGVILWAGAIVEERRFNKRNLINHDQEKGVTTIVYGNEE